MKKDLKNLILVISTNLGNVLFSFIQAVLLARLLDVSDRGYVQLFIVTSTIFSSFFISGAGNTIAYCIRHGKKKGYLNFLLLLSVVLIAGIMVRYATHANEQHAKIFMIQVFCLCCMQLTVELLKIQASLFYYKIYAFTTPLIFLIITSYIFITHDKISADFAIILTVSSSFISALIGIPLSLKVMSERLIEEKIPLGMFCRYYIKQYVLQLFGIITNNMDKYLIGSFLGITPLGLYSIAASFNTLPLKLYNALSDYLFSGYINNRNNSKLVLVVSVGTGAIGILLSYLLSKYLIIIAFGDRYLESHIYLPFIILNMVISGISWVLTQKALVAGNQILIIIRQAIGLLVFAAIFYYAKDYGLWGAIMALISGSIIRLAISVAFFIKIKI